MRFVPFEEVAARLHGKSVVIVGSGPSVLQNTPWFVDSHEVVVRVNNHKVGGNAGLRTDVHYSFYGTSIRKPRDELQREGVTLCMCKCPNAKPIESEWHVRNSKPHGVDFRYIYERRRAWWFCDTFVPDVPHFLRGFELLGRHIPTTGFAAILDVLACAPRIVSLTGFDFFSSGIHNVNERWRPGDPTDPIGHRPDLEAQWLADNADKHLLALDPILSSMLNQRRRAVA